MLDVYVACVDTAILILLIVWSIMDRFNIYLPSQFWKYLKYRMEFKKEKNFYESQNKQFYGNRSIKVRPLSFKLFKSFYPEKI